MFQKELILQPILRKSMKALNRSKKTKLLVITGGGQGIGAFLAKKFSDIYFVLIISKSRNCLDLSSQINKKIPGSAMGLQMDFEKKIDVKKLHSISFKNFESINILFCAGYLENYSNEVDIYEWKKVFNVNLFGNVEIFDFFARKIKNLNVEKNFIFFSGGGAANAFEAFPAYSASKTALVRSIENFSASLEPYNFNIFALAPGAIKTKMLDKVLKSSNVGTRTTKSEVYAFIRSYLLNPNKNFNGRLIHVRDDITTINKNLDSNFLKLRRVQ